MRRPRATRYPVLGGQLCESSRPSSNLTTEQRRVRKNSTKIMVSNRKYASVSYAHFETKRRKMWSIHFQSRTVRLVAMAPIVNVAGTTPRAGHQAIHATSHRRRRPIRTYAHRRGHVIQFIQLSERPRLVHNLRNMSRPMELGTVGALTLASRPPCPSSSSTST